MLFERRHPEMPWLTPTAVLLLANWLKPSDAGFEWGSGRSTSWFAERVARLTSVEDNLAWHSQVKKKLESSGLAAKVNYRYVTCELLERDEPSSHPYAEVVNELPPCSLDFALVDGNIRFTCMKFAVTRIKCGGLLILDNANRYVPNPFGPRFSTVDQPRTTPRSAAWAELLESLKSWRAINTLNRIWDTRFWVKT
jgi:hypothetical protein